MTSNAESLFAFQLAALKLPPANTEYRFHPIRQWRFDFSWPDRMLAVEIDGAVWTKGRHVRGYGAIEDMAKMNEAQRLGWRVLRFPTRQVKDGSAIEYVRKMLSEPSPRPQEPLKLLESAL